MPAPTRTERVIEVLHGAGHAGMTASELAKACGRLRVYDVTSILHRLLKRGQVTILGARRRPRRLADEAAGAPTKLEEVWACRCRHTAGHREPDPVDDADPAEPAEGWARPLSDETRARGHEGVAAARAALAEAQARRQHLSGARR